MSLTSAAAVIAAHIVLDKIAVAMVPGARSAVSERPLGGSYLNIGIDRDAAARYGVNVRDAQMVIASAVGGMEITQTVEGRERYGVRLRYPQELRDRPEKLAEVLVSWNLMRRLFSLSRKVSKPKLSPL